MAPFTPPPQGLLRDARAENRAAKLLGRYLQPGEPLQYSTYDEEEVYRFLDEGVPTLMNEGEVYLTDAFRNLQAPPPKISVGVSVQGSVLDLEVDTGEFPVGELKALLKSLHQKKRCRFTAPPVWTGRCRARAASASTGTMPSDGSAGASTR